MMPQTLVLFAFFSHAVPGAAQVGLDPEVVASYRSSFSSGKILKDDDGELTLQLNGDVMSHTEDEHRYHELLVHPSILTADSAQRVLIIGGAEGATAREVLRHKRVQNVTMVDIDMDLVSMCRAHLHTMHQGSFDSPKLRVVYADGAVFLKKVAPASFDSVIVDGIDFGSYGNVLFAQEFYESVHRSLVPGGTFAQYVGDVDRQKELRSAGFDEVLNFGIDIWSYPGWGARFHLASKQVKEPLEERLLKNVETAETSLKMAYLNVAHMKAALQHKGRRLKGGGGGGVGGGRFKMWHIPMLIVTVLGGICFCCWYRSARKKEKEANQQHLNPFKKDVGEEALLTRPYGEENQTPASTHAMNLKTTRRQQRIVGVVRVLVARRSQAATWRR
jgi:spermidine synthase